MSYNEFIKNAIEANKDEQPTDYIDPETGLRFCGICHKAKQQVIHKACFERYSYIVPKNCDCKEARMEAKAKREAEEKRLQTVVMLRERCFEGKGEERDFTFDNDDSYNSKLSKQLQEWVENYTPSCKDWLLLYGDCGGGKSFYAAAICNAIVNKGYSAKFTSISEIAQQLWDCENKHGAYNTLVVNPSLLVIDDFHSERDTDYMSEIVFNVIDGRYRSGKATVITTNLAPADILKPDSLKIRRVMSRISANMIPIFINHPDRRFEAFKKREGQK